MKRLSRDHLYFHLISSIKFDKRLKNAVSDAVLYEVVDRFCDFVSTGSKMVVTCSGRDQLSPQGVFGRDEPWPDWVSREDLIMEGLLKPDPLAEPPKG